MKRNSESPIEFHVYEKLEKNDSIQFSDATAKERTDSVDLGTASALLTIPAGVIPPEEEGTYKLLCRGVHSVIK